MEAFITTFEERKYHPSGTQGPVEETALLLCYTEDAHSLMMRCGLGHEY